MNLRLCQFSFILCMVMFCYQSCWVSSRHDWKTIMTIMARPLLLRRRLYSQRGISGDLSRNRCQKAESVSLNTKTCQWNRNSFSLSNLHSQQIIMASPISKTLLHLPELTQRTWTQNFTPPPGGFQPGHQPTLAPPKNIQRSETTDRPPPHRTPLSASKTPQNSKKSSKPARGTSSTN